MTSRLGRLSLVALATALFCLALSRPAHAYLDPGTGSFLLQLLAGALLGALFVLKTWWGSIIAFIARIFKKDKSSKDGK